MGAIRYVGSGNYGSYRNTENQAIGNVSKKRTQAIDGNLYAKKKRPVIGVMRFESSELSPKARQFETGKGGILA